MERLDRVFTENFQLKRELAYEKKRYIDLMNAFLELRNSTKGPPIHQSTSFTNDKSLLESREDHLVKEKQALETTLMSLTEEVESLS